jgi:hypothetical protein
MYLPQLIFDNLPEANRQLQELVGSEIYILPITGTDIFYTDGTAAHASYKIVMPDSSMNFLMADGACIMAFSKQLSLHIETISEFIRNCTRSNDV